WRSTTLTCRDGSDTTSPPGPPLVHLGDETSPRTPGAAEGGGEGTAIHQKRTSPLNGFVSRHPLSASAEYPTGWRVNKKARMTAATRRPNLGGSNTLPGERSCVPPLFSASGRPPSSRACPTSASSSPPPWPCSASPPSLPAPASAPSPPCTPRPASSPPAGAAAGSACSPTTAWTTSSPSPDSPHPLARLQPRQRPPPLGAPARQRRPGPPPGPVPTRRPPAGRLLFGPDAPHPGPDVRRQRPAALPDAQPGLAQAGRAPGLA